MKVTIIYDNEVYKEGLEADWGFSALIEVENSPRILFDTGADPRILLSNMKKLDINPDSIEEIFISHAHYDHTGGLLGFLEINNDVTLYIPPSFRGSFKARDIITVESSREVHKNITTTGEIDGVEQSLCARTDKGIVIIVGCSHPGIDHILTVSRRFGNIYGIIGGLHGFRDFELFSDFGLICATHCTQHKKEIEDLYPETFTRGGAGRIITI